VTLPYTLPRPAPLRTQEVAFEKSQKYKEGKFILERCGRYQTDSSTRSFV